MKLFAIIDRPGRHLPKAPYARWYTWSNDFKSLLAKAVPLLRQLPRPKLARIPNLRTYNRTFTLPKRHELPVAMRSRFRAAARALLAARPLNELMLFDGMLDGELGSDDIRAVLALLRDSLSDELSDPRAALYTPLGVTGHATEFKLHSDLYLADHLFNIFDDVPSDGTGGSTFLSRVQLASAFSRVPSLPRTTQLRVLNTLDGTLTRDGFDRLYDTLHGEHRWTSDLQRVLSAMQLTIGLRRGQGYLINDRRWLHGRDRPSSRIRMNRVHRLVFLARRGAGNA